MFFVVANVLQPLIDLCDWILRFWHDDVGFGWGASIIGMTAVVRLMILPLTFRGVKGMQDMQRLAPEMQRLKERYKDDKQRQNQEIMKLYQEHKVNPLSSCLPLLLQIPFFISLFYLLRDDEFEREIRGEESFLFIPDLADPATGLVLAVLIVVYVATQLASGLVTASSSWCASCSPSPSPSVRLPRTGSPARARSPRSAHVASERPARRRARAA